MAVSYELRIHEIALIPPRMILLVRSVAFRTEIVKLLPLGSITLLDSQTIVVSPWDKSLIGTISKAIREGELNLKEMGL